MQNLVPTKISSSELPQRAGVHLFKDTIVVEHENGVFNANDVKIQVNSKLVWANDQVMVFEDGSLWRVNDGVDCLGKVEEKILHADLSPDQELLCLVTESSLVLLSAFDWVSVAESSFDSAPSEELVNVGWGKKETQFHGTAGKEAAKLSGTEPFEMLSSDDDYGARVSWRADGEFLVVNRVFHGYRKLAVFNREAILISTSEGKRGFKSPLVAWKGTSNRIACIEQEKDREVIFFFEKNGLIKHDERIQFEGRVRDISFNHDETLLMVNTFDDKLMLFSCSNYCWECKITLKGVEKCLFDAEDSFSLQFVRNDTINNISFSKQYTVSESGWIAVIDGSKVKLTALHKQIIPPPLCTTTLIVEEPVARVFFCNDLLRVVGVSKEFVYRLEPLELLNSSNESTSFISNVKLEWNGHEISMQGSNVLSDDECLISNATSFAIHGEYILFTTFEHCIEIHKDSNQLIEKRKIERGAVVVAVLNDKVILQMPRGNLETIYPRTFMLAKVKSLVGQVDYLNAFLTCRTHRLDMNVLVDFDREQFIHNIQMFVSQLSSDQISLFVTFLQKDVNEICDHLLASLLACDSVISTGTFKNRAITKFVQPRMVCLMKKNSVLEALELIADESTLDYISFLGDEKTLYEEALGTYDMELFLFVAKKSSRDPKEYLTFLDSLQELPEWERRFKIDDHLERRQKAASHLYTAGEMNKFIQYIKLHQELLPQALLMTLPKEEWYLKVLEMYASTVTGEEAFLSYYRLGCKEKIIELGMLLGHYQEVLMADSSSASTVCRALIEKHDHEHAATVALMIPDIDLAVQCYCECHLFLDAMLVAQRNNRNDLVDTVVKVYSNNYIHVVQEEIKDIKESFLKKSDRLERLRNAPPTLLEEGEEAIDDNASVITATSIGSSSTRKTKTRARRKELRQRLRGKKGGPFEEEYLMLGIKRMFLRLEALSKEMKGLNRYFVAIKDFSSIGSMNEGLEALFYMFEGKRSVIFKENIEEPKPVEIPEALVFKKMALLSILK